VPRDRVEYADLTAFLTDAGGLARSLLRQGIAAMKIWPFDIAALRNDGQYISAAEMQTGLEPIKRVRDAVGDDVDVMIELHAMWNFPTAERIAEALTEYKVKWIEDPINPSNNEALRRLTSRSAIPVAAGETLAGHDTYRRLIADRSVDVVILDPVWCGGITAAWDVATMAGEANLEVAFHDCTGPVALAVATHLALASPTAKVQEMVRSWYFGWYSSLATGVPVFDAGTLLAPVGVGVGVELVPDLRDRPGTHVRMSEVV
jgi:L-alanine-DL-glutamate epimerase-like enolase superfamily enzyme